MNEIFCQCVTPIFLSRFSVPLLILLANYFLTLEYPINPLLWEMLGFLASTQPTKKLGFEVLSYISPTASVATHAPDYVVLARKYYGELGSLSYSRIYVDVQSMSVSHAQSNV
ncbi:hypothetical protein NIES4074_63210 (plasmid) [Cylindrospermum sp. NIES-4074]|nr:hypothetical protein NIES4074_63210 [Cylindrospermum sp. NIES-4074]